MEEGGRRVGVAIGFRVWHGNRGLARHVEPHMGSTRHITTSTTTSIPTTIAGRAAGRPRRDDRRRVPGRAAAATVLLAALALSACGADHSDDSADSGAATEERADVGSADELTIEGGEANAAESPADTDDRAATPATAGGPATGTSTADFGRDLVVDAGVTMVTADVGTAVDDVIDITSRNGGAVYNTEVNVQDPREDGSVPGSARIVIRVPPTQLDGLIDDLHGAGTLRNQTQSVDDVTDQLIDLDIQIRQAFESVERMEAILAETTDFDGLVAAETELVRRQTAYERLLAAQRNVDDRVALSKLTVQIQYQAPGTEPAPVIDEGDPGIADAFADGWNAFVGLLFGLAFVLAVTAPFIAVAALTGAAAWLIGRRLRRRQHALRNRHEPLDGHPAGTPADAAGDSTATTAWPEPAPETDGAATDDVSARAAAAVSADASPTE